jgi:hypothetical protein
MAIDRRELIGLAVAAAAGSVGLTAHKPEQQATPPQFIDQWIVKHGGDCCGCAISKNIGNNEYCIVCNECGEQLDVMVSEIAFNRMAEALQRAEHALCFAHGQIAHDGKPERAYPLDFSNELRFIDETLQMAGIESKPLDPLP